MKVITNSKVGRGIITAVSFSVLLAGCSSDNVDREVATNNPIVSAQDKAVHTAMKDYFNNKESVGAMVGVYRDNAVSWYGYGQVAKGSADLPNEKTLFEIGSVTKTFTSALVVSWLEEKKRGLDSPIAPFLPSRTAKGLSKENKDVTFRQLLNYTSGLPEDQEIGDLTTTPGYNAANPFMHYDSLNFYQYLEKNTLLNVPGTQYRYSNMAFGLAGLILTRNTGKSFGDIVAERITNPLKMEDTGVSPAGAQTARMAKGYGADGKEVARWKSIGAFESAGILVSSAADMIKFGRAHLGKEQTDLTKIFAVTQKESFSYTTNIGIEKTGLGWDLFDVSVAGGGVLKSGGTGGYTSLITVAPAKNMVIVVLFNNAGRNAQVAAGALAAALLKL